MKKCRWHDMSLKEVVVTDAFWNHYRRLVKDVIIPYQWNVLNDREPGVEPSFCIHNFKVAAGEVQGEIQGVVFLDSDLAKWLEAVAYTLETEPDVWLEQTADEVIELIGRSQCEDGYLGTYFSVKAPDQRFRNLQEGHELYTAGHMIEAAVAYYQATGKPRFLNIVRRMADLLCATFGPEEGQRHGYPGHQEIELALVKLSRVTGERRYMDLAKYFIDSRGSGEDYFLEEQRQGRIPIFSEFREYRPEYFQAHKPVREQQKAKGHSVRAVYMYSAMADLAYEYQDEELLAASKRLWDNIVHKRMYITGGIGSSGILERFTTDYDLPNDRGYAETCASIGMAMFGKRMAQITKQASYMDTVELELYNNILAGIALDGKHFFYVNPLEVWPDNCLPGTSMEHVKPNRQKWFGVACCPPNIARTLASIGQYVLFRDDEGIYLNLYISCRFSTCIKDTPVTLTVESKAPWQGFCDITIETEKTKPLVVAFRIPSYASSFSMSRAGAKVPFEIKAGYAYITVNSKLDKLTIVWSLRPRFIRANPAVKADIGKAAVMYGPLVYCLEEADNGTNLPGFFVDSSQSPRMMTDDRLFPGMIALTLSGKRIKPWREAGALYDEAPPRLEDKQVLAVPYFLWNNRQAGEMLLWMHELL